MCPFIHIVFALWQSCDLIMAYISRQALLISVIYLAKYGIAFAIFAHLLHYRIPHTRLYRNDFYHDHSCDNHPHLT